MVYNNFILVDMHGGQNGMQSKANNNIFMIFILGIATISMTKMCLVYGAVIPFDQIYITLL